MKIENIILILLIITTSTAFQTASTTSDSSTYHVMATSGLKMRATPSGKKLLTIPYNGEVEKINDGKSYGDLTVTELKDFKIKGEWVKVRYDGQEGFVFDGFLTQFPMPDLDMKMDYDKYSSGFAAFLDKNFTQKGSEFNLRYHDDHPNKGVDNSGCAFSLDYEEGHFYRQESCSESGSQYDIEIIGITLVEAYFIIKAFDFNNMKEYKGKPFEVYKYDAKNKTIIEDPDGAGCWLSARQRRQNSVIIDMGCGC
jgi:hypothetical protein